VLGGLFLFAHVAVLLASSGRAYRENPLSYVEMAESLLVAAAFAWAAWSVKGLGRRSFLGWTLLALAFSAYAAGDLLAAIFKVTLSDSPLSVAMNCFYLLFYPLFLAGVLGLPKAPLKRTDQARMLLDLGVVLASACIAVWALLLQPLIARSSPEAMTLALTLAYPVGDMVLLWSVLFLYFRGREPETRWSYRFLGISATILILTDLFYSYQILSRNEMLYPWASLGFATSHLMAMLAALQRPCVPRELPAGEAQEPLRARPAIAAMILAFTSLALAWVVLLRSGQVKLSVLSLVMIPAVVVLVLARQTLETLVNRNLLSGLRAAREELERRVQDRTSELREAIAELQAEIRERERAQEERRATEERFGALVQNSNDIITIHDTQGRILYESPSFSRILKHPPGALNGVAPFHLIHPEDRALAAQSLASIAAKTNTGIPTEYRFQRGDGSWVFLESVGSNLLDNPAVKGIVLTSREVTERKRAEEEIHRKLKEMTVLSAVGAIAVEAEDEETLISRITEVIQETLYPDNCGVLLVDEEGGVLRHSDSYHARDPRLSRDTIPLGKGITGGVATTGLPRRVGRAAEDPDYVALDPDMASEICVPLKVGGRIIGVVDAESREKDAFTENDEQILTTLASQIATSIERLRAAKALKESEERFRVLSEAAFEGIGITESGRILDANRQLAEILGGSIDQIVGREVTEFVVPEHQEKVLSSIRTGNVDRYEHVARRLDGSLLYVETQGRNLPYQGRTVRVSAIRDVSERRRAEERIRRQLQRLEGLRAIDSAITSSMDLHATLGVFLEQVTRQLSVDAAAVLLLDPADQTLQYALGTGFRTEALRRTRLRLGECYAGKAALQRRVLQVQDLADDPNGFTRSPLLMSEGFHAYFAAPLIARGQVKGVFEVFHRSRLDPDEEWLNYLQTLAGQAAIALDNMSLFLNLQTTNVELGLAYETTLEGWSKALELRDRETQGHTVRVAEMTVRLAREAGIPDKDLVHVRRGALLHDIGKMGIPDSILLKPGPLTEEEWEIMRQHPVHAYDLLSPITFLRPALEIPYCHHERWDGTGYPRGLRGEQIPLSARVFAVVDSWDALSFERPYRSAWPPERVREFLVNHSGKNYDPRILEIFLDRIV
jgi:PAS domain S-box-containing protein/putative nucleotidyltransferase with HDIG domain